MLIDSLSRARLNLLLDTHILLWTLNDPERLPAACRSAIESPRNDIWISSISIWEAVIKANSGKLKVDANLVEAIEAQSMRMLPFTGDHAVAVSHLPMHHSDPFDRALVATCVVAKLRFVTADQVMRQYARELDLMFVG